MNKSNIIRLVLVSLIAITTTFGQGTQSGRIQGTWDEHRIQRDCSTGEETGNFHSMLTYHEGGTVMAIYGSFTLQGVWRQTRGNTYATSLKFFLPNNGWALVYAQIVVSQTGNSYEGGGVFQTYDAAGNLTIQHCLTLLGTRFDL